MPTTKPTPRMPKFYSVLDMHNLPPLEELGLLPMVSEDRAWWTPGEQREKPDLTLARKHAATLNPAIPLTLDWEDRYDPATKRLRALRFDIRKATCQQVADDIADYCDLIDAYRAGGFTGDIGIYGFIPIREVDWNILTRDARYPAEQRSWKFANGVFQPLIDRVNFIAPSLYAIGPDIAQHILWTGAVIDQAKRYGKPVIAYVSPESHWAATGGFARQMLSQPQWQATLELVRSKAIDAAIWLGGDNTFKHDMAESPMWWECLDTLRMHWNSVK